MTDKNRQKLKANQGGPSVLMVPTIRPRATGVRVIDFVKATVTKTFSGMCGILSVPLTIASPFIPTPEVGKIAVLMLGVICFLQATYSAWETERTRAMNLHARIARQGRLVIEFDPEQRRFNEQEIGLYKNPKRTLSVRVRNVGGNTVGDCKLYVVSVEPNEGNLAGDVRMLGFTQVNLNPEDTVYVRLVTYGEPGTNINGDTMGMLHVPFTANSEREDERTIGTNTDYVVTLRATGSGSDACIRQFRIWIRDQHLQMAAIPT